MSGGFSFGGGAVQKTTGFGFTGTTSTLSFGAASQPTQTTGLTFGSLGQSGLSFGTPAQQQPQQPASGLTFGAAASSQPGLSFGQPAAPASTQSGLTFGTPSATPQGGLSFGTPATSAPVFGAGTPGFGQTGLGFGAPTTAAATSTPTGFSFGAPSGVATTATTTKPSLGGFGLNFGGYSTAAAAAATTTAAPLSFGLGAPAATTKPTSLFTAPALTATTTSAPTSLGFGLSAPSTIQTTGFSLGGGTGVGTGLFSAPGGKPFGALGSTAPSTAAATTSSSVGLGGIDPSQSKLGLAGTGARPDAKVVKENHVPNEILHTVDNFKAFMKTQKNLSSDIARGSVKPLNKVQEEIESLKQTLASLQNGIQRSSALVVKLKSDTAKCLQNAEMAQRTHETPAGLQYDNTAPLKYFQDLVGNFEHEMQIFRNEINNTEKHLHSLMQPMPLTSQELALAMRRLHDSFVALAGRLQSVHNSIEAEKNQYLLLRKYFLKDSTNIFEEEAKKSVLTSTKSKCITKASAGPTPFSALGAQHGFGLLSSSSTVSKAPLSSGWSGGQSQPQSQQLLQQQPQQQQQPLQLHQSQFSAPTLSSSLFGGPSATLSTLTSPQPVENQNFQLQKPPLGNKRGKR